ncbi:hypothetical protein [Halobaculum sp. EA56]|uniref:hypothetical protein n=1 Tax=Halobaculum sp. EA56 TaxID=3421648 RepID=UPI003EC05C82
MDGTDHDGAAEEPGATVDGRPVGIDDDGTLDRVARYMARELCAGFRYHDRGERSAAVESFAEVDRRQFSHVGDDRAERAARAYVDALWAKDDIENAHAVDGDPDRDALAAADWAPVRQPLAERADLLGMDREYATATTRAWREHKAGGDYWTPMLRAQAIEFRTAVGDDAYPGKPSDGQSGFGPAPVRYLVGVELHDLHERRRWAEAERVMQPYYRRILAAHRDG